MSSVLKLDYQLATLVAQRERPSFRLGRLLGDICGAFNLFLNDNKRGSGWQLKKGGGYLAPEWPFRPPEVWRKQKKAATQDARAPQADFFAAKTREFLWGPQMDEIFGGRGGF